MDGQQTPNLIVGGDGQVKPSGIRALWYSTRSKVILLAALSLMVLIGAGTAYYFASTHTTNSADVKKITQKRVDQAVGKTIENPDYAAAGTELNKQLQETNDKKKQADIYVGLASIALQQGKYQEVIDNELLAAKADPSRADALALTIGDAYAQLGKKAEALKYYQQALAYYNAKPENFIGRKYYITSTQTKITEIQK
jgi:tetratricopeptide (TPR) repeat protein